MVRFVRGGLGRSINGIVSTFYYGNVHDTIIVYIFRTVNVLCCRRSRFSDELKRSNVSALTFELANANSPQPFRIVGVLVDLIRNT